ncbi:MAG: hypothetical protein K2H65_02615, partial [Bacteroidales bacterium]|nr:hypothetical protein [Bacteroidales bacterium]
MKGIRLLFRWLAVMMFLWLSMCFSSAWAASHKVDGKVTFVIESKKFTASEAQSAITSKTAVPLKVSLIFEGEWVTQLATLNPYLNSSAFAFGIAASGGASAPLLTTNLPAYIYAASSKGCTAPDGGSLSVPMQPMGVYVAIPAWETQPNCPVFAYGTLFSSQM